MRVELRVVLVHRVEAIAVVGINAVSSVILQTVRTTTSHGTLLLGTFFVVVVTITFRVAEHLATEVAALVAFVDAAFEDLVVRTRGSCRWRGRRCCR